MTPIQDILYTDKEALKYAKQLISADAVEAFIQALPTRATKTTWYSKVLMALLYLQIRS